MPEATMVSPKQQFLDVFDDEFERTMRVLRAYPADKLDLRPSPKSKTARELGWIFPSERGLGIVVLNKQFGPEIFEGPQPEIPENWQDILAAFEKMNTDYRALVDGFSEEQMMEPVKFMTGPKQVGDMTRLNFAWFMLMDQIHHRGQFSVHLRMADGKVPSIYGPSLDEPWD